MDTQLRTELILPPSIRFLGLAMAFVREMAQVAGLAPQDAAALALAVEEAFANSVEHAFDLGEQGIITMSSDLSPRALTLSIRDKGLPFDASVAPVYHPPKEAVSPDMNIQGLGLHLIHHAVDEVRWINHGREGKELRLVKSLPREDPMEAIADHGPPSAPEGTSESREGSCTIRRLAPEDALKVSQCFFRSYGYSYEEDLYLPERLVHLNHNGTFVSVVAVDNETGEIAGHVALVREEPGPVGEYTHLAVLPGYRGHGLRKRMGDFLEEEVRKLGIIGLYGQAVTTHVISQQASESRGFKVCGICLGMGMPFSFKKIKASKQKPLHSSSSNGEASQRESLVFYFKYLAPPTPALLHIPESHRTMIARIYEGLEAPFELGKPASPSGMGAVEVSYWREEKFGEIVVHKIGQDTFSEIRRARRDMCEIAGAEVVHLLLPLGLKETPELCMAAEEDGFLFSAVKPSFSPEGDLLQLQFIHSELNLDRLQIHSPFAEEILDYALRKRTGHQ